MLVINSFSYVFACYYYFCYWPQVFLATKLGFVSTQYARISAIQCKIDKTKTDIYHKDTHTGQYVHFTSFEPWYRKTAWVKSLVERAERICSNKHLFETEQILEIKSFMSWNGYPICVCNSVLKRLRERKKNSRLSKMRSRLQVMRKTGCRSRDAVAVPRCGLRVARCRPQSRNVGWVKKSR